MHLRHRGFLPTFDNRLAFQHRRKRFFASDQTVVKPSDQNGSRWLSCIQAGERVQAEVSLTASRRGVHPLPNVEAKTHFPFYLFECRRIYSAGTTGPRNRSQMWSIDRSNQRPNPSLVGRRQL
jgi:hypothetical protein